LPCTELNADAVRSKPTVNAMHTNGESVMAGHRPPLADCVLHGSVISEPSVRNHPMLSCFWRYSPRLTVTGQSDCPLIEPNTIGYGFLVDVDETSYVQA
jgi:hypothetical protein